MEAIGKESGVSSRKIEQIELLIEKSEVLRNKYREILRNKNELSGGRKDQENEATKMEKAALIGETEKLEAELLECFANFELFSLTAEHNGDRNLQELSVEDSEKEANRCMECTIL